MRRDPAARGFRYVSRIIEVKQGRRFDSAEEFQQQQQQ
jgi:hypothetical protein